MAGFDIREHADEGFAGVHQIQQRAFGTRDLVYGVVHLLRGDTLAQTSGGVVDRNIADGN